MDRLPDHKMDWPQLSKEIPKKSTFKSRALLCRTLLEPYARLTLKPILYQNTKQLHFSRGSSLGAGAHFPVVFHQDVLCGLPEIPHQRERPCESPCSVPWETKASEALGKLVQVPVAHLINSFMYPVACVPTLPLVKIGRPPQMRSALA